MEITETEDLGVIGGRGSQSFLPNLVAACLGAQKYLFAEKRSPRLSLPRCRKDNGRCY